MMTSRPMSKNTSAVSSTSMSISSSTSTSRIDSFSSELSRLTLEERSYALHDVHGVSDKQCETLEMIQSKIQEMKQFLSVMANRGGEDSLAYRKAKIMDSNHYVDGLHLRFLRADGYNSHNAARRMLRFFERKSELFGEDKLGREIQLQDLNAVEREALKHGSIQVLPIRDQAGRAILFIHGQVHSRYACTKSMTRVFFYFMMATLRDKESQINGTVLVYYGLGQKKIYPGRMSEFLKSWESIPWRFASCHYCKQQQQCGILQPALSVVANSLNGTVLSRFRLHTGTHMEVLFNLMTFGIPKDAIPVDYNGCMRDLSHHHKILDSLGYAVPKKGGTTTTREKGNRAVSPAGAQADVKSSLGRLSSSGETMTNRRDPAAAISFVLGPVDVLMGRGHHPKRNPGALRLHNLLLDYNERYNAADRLEKTAISRKILEQMKEMGSKFMAPISGGFVECDDSVSRAKIAHGFRNLRLKGVGSNSSSGSSANNNNNPAQKKKNGNKRTLSEEDATKGKE